MKYLVGRKDISTPKGKMFDRGMNIFCISIEQTKWLNSISLVRYDVIYTPKGKIIEKGTSYL